MCGLYLVKALHGLDQPCASLLVTGAESAEYGIGLHPAKARWRRRDLVELHAI